MPWIESHQTVGHHPKTIRFAELLKVNLPTAVGHLHYFWWWALDFAPSGEIRTTPGVLARACEWRGNADRFRDALLAAGFVEWCNEALIIHDWMDYAGRYVGKRAANTERQRRYRDAHVTRDSGVSNAPVDSDVGVSSALVTGLPTGPTLTNQPGLTPARLAGRTARAHARGEPLPADLPNEVLGRLGRPPIGQPAMPARPPIFEKIETNGAQC